MHHDLRKAARTAALAAALLPLAAGAAEVSASRIERVTVYPGLAAVERSAPVAAGARELVLDCLSPAFDLANLRIDADAGIRIGPVSASSRPRTEVPACQAGPLDARIRALEDRIAALQAESGGHDLALGYLRALAPADAASGSGRGAAAAGPAALAAFLAAIQHGGQQALAEQHRIDREREALERELTPLRAERDRAGRAEGEVRQLRIALDAAQAGSLRLHYPVPGPSWAPGYRATLDTEAQAVDIERLAQVSQRSGEDWTGVALRLSTGSPRSATAGPLPRRWEVSPQPPQAPAQRLRGFMPALAAAAPTAAQATAATRDGAEPLSFEVQVSQGEFGTEFDVPGLVDVGSGAHRVGLALGRTRWPVTVKVRTTPQDEASAWVVAEAAAPEGVWPDGPLQLLRGNQTVGQAVWHTTAGERLSLPFGRDELVQVKVLPAQQHSTTTGLIGVRSERRISRAYTVENRHRKPVAVEVLEASPVSTDEKITVTRQFDPAPQAGNWREEPGVVAWTATLAPGQTARFGAEYTISHPRDLAVFDQR